MNGKLTTALCGHPGRVVIGQYIECLKRCHVRACTCGKSEWQPFKDPRLPIDSVSCVACGKIVWSHDGK